MSKKKKQPKISKKIEKVAVKLEKDEGFSKLIDGLLGPSLGNEMKRLDKREDKLIANQNEQTLGIATVYDLLKVIAKKLEITKLPKQRIDMSIEDEKTEV